MKTKELIIIDHMKIGVNKQRNWCQQTAGPVRQTKPSVCVAAPKKPLLHFYPFLLLCFLCLEFALWVKSFKTSGGYHGMVMAVDCPGRENLSSFKKSIQSLYIIFLEDSIINKSSFIAMYRDIR